MTKIKIGYCPCGLLKQMKSFEIAEGHRRQIEVYCACGAEEKEVTDIPLFERYTLVVETRAVREGEELDHTDQGDV